MLKKILERIWLFLVGLMLTVMFGILLINQVLTLTGHPVWIDMSKHGSIHVEQAKWTGCISIPFCSGFLLFGLLCVYGSLFGREQDEDNKNDKDGDNNTG